MEPKKDLKGLRGDGRKNDYLKYHHPLPLEKISTIRARILYTVQQES